MAVIIRQIKDDELLKLQESESALVVGRGRLYESDFVEMLSNMRRNPDKHNPIEVAKKYKIDIHTATLISLSVKIPLVVRDPEGNIVAQ